MWLGLCCNRQETEVLGRLFQIRKDLKKKLLLNPAHQLCNCKKKVILYNKEEYLAATSEEEICSVGRYNAFLEKHTAETKAEKEAEV